MDPIWKILISPICLFYVNLQLVFKIVVVLMKNVGIGIKYRVQTKLAEKAIQ